MKINILYLTYDGLTDSLGQSQILPYLQGAAATQADLGHTHQISLISFDKKKAFEARKEIIKKQCDDNEINWFPISYTKKPPVFSTLYDLKRMQKKAEACYLQQPYQIVHCRSYVPMVVGLYLKKKYGVKLIFDMRGYWADERVEGNIWDLKKILYKLVYQYFKRKEIDFLQHADTIITLTHASKKELETRYFKNKNTLPTIQVIPCCVDTSLFNPHNIDPQKQANISHNLSATELQHNDFKGFTLGYLGSMGTWYLMPQMLDFYKCLLQYLPQARFLIISHDAEAQKNYLAQLIEQKQLPQNQIIAFAANRENIPYYITLCNSMVFFMKSGFSRIACSPVKQAEIMQMGVPVVCNAGIGDTDWVIQQSKAGWVLPAAPTPTDYIEVCKKIAFMYQNPQAIHPDFNAKVAQAFVLQHFNLQNAIHQYCQVYAQLVQ